MELKVLGCKNGMNCQSVSHRPVNVNSLSFLSGEAGHKGIPGLQGPPGARGPRGPQGPRLAGVSYNRWGRTSCSGNATVVYTGKEIFVVK